jgi:putative transposase
MRPIKRTKQAVYDLKYRFVWIPKYRKKLLTEEVPEYIGKIFQQMAEGYEWEIEEMAIETKHIHLFIHEPPKYSPAKVVQIVKSISAREIFRRYPEIREQLWAGEIWSDGYFVRSVGDKITTEVIKNYIRYHKTDAHLPEQLGL